MGEGPGLLPAVSRLSGQRAQRTRAGEHLLGLGERVGGRAKQGSRDARVRAPGEDQYVVEEQEQHQEDRGGQQRLRQRVDVQAPVAGPARAVREVAELPRRAPAFR